MYPKGERVQNTLEELNIAEQRLLDELKNRSLIRPYGCFLLSYTPDRVKFGIKTEKGLEKELSEVENELKQKYTEYSNLALDCGTQDPNTCELIAIATECRLSLLKIFPRWTDEEKIADIVHFMLNPYGYDREAWAHLLALLNIKGGITDKDVRDAVTCVSEILHRKDRIEWRNNRCVLKRERP